MNLRKKTDKLLYELYIFELFSVSPSKRIFLRNTQINLMMPCIFLKPVHQLTNNPDCILIFYIF